MKRLIGFLIFAILLGTVSSARASVMINEIFFNPAGDLTGDAQITQAEIISLIVSEG